MGDAFWGIGASATRCGGYAWLEGRLFELTGVWASSPTTGDGGYNVHCSVMSARHAALAAAWRERLPVRAGIDREALAVAPPGPLAGVLDALAAEPAPAARVAGLVNVVLARLVETYSEHQARSSPVNEAPVRAVLEVALAGTGREIDLGRMLLQQGLDDGAGAVTDLTRFCQQLERPFGGARGVFPAAWPS